MNGVNLNQSQFEYDLTWMSFFQNAGGRTYLRYGGREDSGPETHLNQPSLLRAMDQALALHAQGAIQPDNLFEPVAKAVLTPEDLPAMKQMMAKRKESCIHCHDVKVAKLRHLRELGQLEKEMVHTYPSPSHFGIHLDSHVQNQIKEVDAESVAAKAGIKAGDTIHTLAGQRVLTLADMSRVLELTPDSAKVKVGLQRGDRTATIQLNLPDRWRSHEDPSWRASTHVVGPSAGLWGTIASDAQRRNLNLDADDLAIRVTFIWGPWTKAAGIRRGDYIAEIDGQRKHMTIHQLQGYLQMNRNWGDTVELTVIRNGKPMPVTMTLPAKPPN